MKAILCGGGDGKQTQKSYAKFVEFIDKEKPVLYIPVAFDGNPKFPYPACETWFRGEMAPFGITNIYMETDMNKLTRESIMQYGGIFIGGGNTFRLLQLLKESTAFEAIQEFLTKTDLPVMGGSAGAIILTEDITICEKDMFNIKHDDINTCGLEDYSGLGALKGYDIMVHYGAKAGEKEMQDKKAELFAKNYSIDVIALPEEASILVDNGKYSVITDGAEPVIYKFGEITKKELLSEWV